MGKPRRPGWDVGKPRRPGWDVGATQVAIPRCGGDGRGRGGKAAIATCVAPTARHRHPDALREHRCPEAGCWKTTAPKVGCGKTTTPGVGCGSDASRDRALRLRGAFIGRRGWESRLASLPRPTPDAGREDARAGFRRSDASRDRATSHPARRKSRSRAAAATGVVEAARLQSRLASLPRQDTEGRMRLQSRLASLPRQDTDNRMRGANADARMRCAPRWVRRWPGPGRAGRLRRGRARKPGG